MSSHLHVGFRSFVIYPCLAGEKILKEKCLEIERGPERGRSGRGGACPPPVSFFEGTDRTDRVPDERLGSRRSPPDSGDRIRGTLPALSSAGRCRGKRGGAIALPVRPDGPGSGLPERSGAGGSGRGQASAD